MKNISKWLFCPKEIFKNLNNNRKTLIFGILFVGFVDILFVLIQYFNEIFLEKTSNSIMQNIILIIIFIVSFGMLDVLVFTVPLFDFFKKFKANEEGHTNKPSIIKLAKIYIIPHLIITPFNIAFIIMIKDLKTVEVTTTLVGRLFFIQFILNLWFCGIISRGINSLYNFNPVYKRFIFLIVYIWVFLFSYVSEVIIDDWILGVLI